MTAVAERTIPTVCVGGMTLHALTEPGCVALVLGELAAGRGGWLKTTNVDDLWLAARDRAYGALCAGATLVVADGMPLVWASRLQGTPLPERVAGSNLLSSLSAAVAARGLPLFLLGGNPGAAGGAATVLRRRHPGLRIVGTGCPPPGFAADPAALAEVIATVAAARPAVVYVALAKPVQERLIVRLRARMPDAWYVGVGIGFSFLTGEVQRAPRWMQRAGLEWGHRLAQEPRRLATRYLLHDLPFAVRLLAGALRARWSGHDG
jgi:N-acetylglucosaminyldiphosphoundecaprenol N-acetyl-beta-D-mannosaminyltransferase